MNCAGGLLGSPASVVKENKQICCFSLKMCYDMSETIGFDKVRLCYVRSNQAKAK